MEVRFITDTFMNLLEVNVSETELFQKQDCKYIKKI